MAFIVLVLVEQRFCPVLDKIGWTYIKKDRATWYHLRQFRNSKYKCLSLCQVVEENIVLEFASVVFNKSKTLK